jgi:hypothetical protein
MDESNVYRDPCHHHLSHSRIRLGRNHPGSTRSMESMEAASAGSARIDVSQPHPAGHMISMAPRKPRLSPERRSALGILADAPHGLTEALLAAHGVTTELLASLVRDGLASVQRQSMKAGGGDVEVTRVKITDAGRRAIEG